MKKEIFREDFLNKRYKIDGLIGERTYLSILNFENEISKIFNIGRINHDYFCDVRYGDFDLDDDIINFKSIYILIRRFVYKNQDDSDKIIAIIRLDLLEDETFRINKELRVCEDATLDVDEYVLRIIKYLDENFS